MATEIDDLKSDLRLAAEFTEKQADDDLMRSAADRIEALEAALREAIEFADQDIQALTPAGIAMVARWTAALPHP